MFEVGKYYLRLGLQYKTGFGLLLLLFVLYIVLVFILLSIDNFHDYYQNAKYGFIPSALVMQDTDSEQGASRGIKKWLDSNNNIEYIKNAKKIELDQVNFEFDNNSQASTSYTIPRDITVWGMDLQGNKSVSLVQAGKKIQTRVKNIDYFGGWILDVQKKPGLSEGRCKLVFNRQEIPMSVVDFGKFHRLNYPGENQAKQSRLYSFLHSFVQRFFNLEHAGISRDRFAAVQGKTVDLDSPGVALKKKILAFAGLIFNDNANKVNALASSSLMESFNRYGYLNDTVLKTADLQISLLLLDAVNYPAENRLRRNILVISKRDFQDIFTGQGRECWFVYFDQSRAESIAKSFADNTQEGSILLKSDIAPSYFQQKNIVQGIVYSLFSLSLVIVLCMAIIKCLQFYALHAQDLAYFKIYGYNYYIYSLALCLILVVAHVPAYILLKLIFLYNNQLLLDYYFLPLQFDASIFYHTLGIGVLLLFCSTITEYFCQKRLDFTLLGESNGN